MDMSYTPLPFDRLDSLVDMILDLAIVKTELPDSKVLKYEGVLLFNWLI